MPGAMDKLLTQLAVGTDARDFAAFDKALVPGTKLPAPSGVFPRYQDGAA
jgi:methionyl-tRNA synthetase